jgi:CRP/FNR family transcriptional regulator
MLSVLSSDPERAPGFRAPKVRCNLCCLKEFCAPEALARDDIEFLKSFVKKQELRLARGGQPYRQGDEFRALIAVHTGSFKICAASAEGAERVTGFAFAGDMMGLNSIDSGRHSDYAVALEDSGVCLLPWERIEEAAVRIPIVRRQLMRMLSREIRHEQEMGLLLGRLPADGRLAAFLLALSRRYASRGFDGERFRLPMSRPDIGSILGLTAETVSRLFTRFRNEGWIQAHGRHLQIRSAGHLRALVERAQTRPASLVTIR